MPITADQSVYTAAGGVVVDAREKVLLLIRPERDEVRLPKGHVEPGESLKETALRETMEETGYGDLEIVTDLGEQLITFLLDGRKIERTEHYYLMRLASTERSSRPRADREQFFVVWVSWDEAEVHLTFEAEKEWIRRAQLAWEASGSG
ncbi:MAG: NUDIX domain-containing protein [Anaerolineae bacterium]